MANMSRKRMKSYLSVSNLFYGVPVRIHGAVVPDVAGGSNGEYKQEENEDLGTFLLVIYFVVHLWGSMVP